MRDEVLATDGESENWSDIGTAHDIDFWRLEAEMPTQLKKVDKAFGVVGVHMREKHGIKLCGCQAELRKPHGGAAPGVELKLERATIIGVVAIADQRPGAGEAVEFRRPTHGPGQRHDHARCSLRRRCGGKKYDTDKQCERD